MNLGRREAVAALLRAHALDLQVDDDNDTTCSCGWDGLELDHEDHVAEQLLTVGVLP